MAGLYLVARDGSTVGYDEFDSFVVVADDEAQASNLGPAALPSDKMYPSWKDDGTITSTLIGIANDDMPIGTVIIASFNAG